MKNVGLSGCVMNTNTIGGIVSIVMLTGVPIASIAIAGSQEFVGLRGQETLRFYEADGLTATDLANAEYAVIDVYARFNNPNILASVVFDLNLSKDGNEFYFHHSDTQGYGNASDSGNWKPSYSFDIPGTTINSNIDSFVTIGGGVGDEAPLNGTYLFGNWTGWNSEIFYPGADWSLLGDLLQGCVEGEHNEVWLGRFVVTGSEARAGVRFHMCGTLGYINTDGACFNGNKGAGFANFCCWLNFERCTRADITGDRVVDGADLNRLLSSWGDCSGGDCSGDLDGNDVIDGADLNILLASWGVCP